MAYTSIAAMSGLRSLPKKPRRKRVFKRLRGLFVTVDPNPIRGEL